MEVVEEFRNSRLECIEAKNNNAFQRILNNYKLQIFPHKLKKIIQMCGNF